MERIHSDIGKLEHEFSDIVDHTFDRIDREQFTVAEFASHLCNLPLINEFKDIHPQFFEEMNSEIEKDIDMKYLRYRLTGYWNYLNYSLLDQLVDKFGDDELKSSLKQYDGMVKDFRRRTHLSYFAMLSPKINKNYSAVLLQGTVKMILGKCWEENQLENLDRLQRSITERFSLPPFTMLLKDIRVLHGVVIQTLWALPSLICHSLKEQMDMIDIQEFLATHSILQFCYSI